jgi:hypothetical protein
MKPRAYYTSGSLQGALREFEIEFGMTSEMFYDMYRANIAIDVPPFEAQVWASFVEDTRRAREHRPEADVMQRVSDTYATC